MLDIAALWIDDFSIEARCERTTGELPGSEKHSATASADFLHSDGAEREREKALILI
jgi:hypothetical protein